jgi:hypothetical protein
MYAENFTIPKEWVYDERKCDQLTGGLSDEAHTTGQIRD